MTEKTSAVVPLRAWQGRTAEELARTWGVPAVHLFERVGSTNDVAAALAEAGCAAGTCVLAEEQVAGRGRERRAWVSPPGLGLWLSLVLRPTPPVDAGVLPLVVGLGVTRGLAPFCRPAEPRLKWPNDVLLAGAKLGGILCEGAWDGPRLRYVVAGIGLNVLHLPDDFPPELRGTATSVRIGSGWSPARDEVCAAVVRAVLDATRTPRLDAPSLAELERRDALLGQQVVIREGVKEVLFGRALGIAADGSLLVRSASGGLRRIRSGSVRLATAAEVAPPELAGRAQENS